MAKTIKVNVTAKDIKENFHNKGCPWFCPVATAINRALKKRKLSHTTGVGGSDFLIYNGLDTDSGVLTRVTFSKDAQKKYNSIIISNPNNTPKPFSFSFKI